MLSRLPPTRIALAVLLLGGALYAGDIPTLVQNLVATDSRQHEAAMKELSALPPEQQQKVAVGLIPLLRGTDVGRRERAAEALQALGPLAAQAIPALKQNLSDDFPYVRIRSAEALAHIGPAAAQALVDALQNDNTMVRLVAVQALEHMGSQSDVAVPALIRVLQDSDTSLRQHAEIALINCGAGAVKALVQALDTPAFKNRPSLVRILGSIDTASAELLSRWIAFLSDPAPELRLAAARALAHKGKSAVPLVIDALNSTEVQVRSQAADILADIGPNAARAVPRLISLLKKDTDGHVRAAAAHALGKMRSAGAPAIPALREALKDTDRDVAARSQEALTAITVTTGGPHEIKGNDVPGSGRRPEPPSQSKPKPKPVAPNKPAIANKPVQTHLPASFLKLDSTAYIKALEMSAQKGTSEVRTLALTALASLLQNQDEKIRGAAAAALERVGTDEALKILAPYKKQEDLKKINRLMAEIQTSSGPVKGAIDELAAMGPVVVPAVTQALKDPKTRVRLAAAQIFTRLGPAASAAVPRLIEALSDKEEAVRSQAAKALEVMNNPEAKNPLRLYYVKEIIRPILEILHLAS